MTLIPTQSYIIDAYLETAAACILGCCYSRCENHAATFVCMLLLGLESGLSNNITFHLFSSQVAEQSDSPVKIPERWHAAWRGTFCDFDKGLTEECREELFLFSPQSMSWLLSLFYNTEFSPWNTHFSLKPEDLAVANPFRSDTIITGWGSKLHSHLLIELSPLCAVLLSVIHSTISSGCFPPSESHNGGLF